MFKAAVYCRVSSDNQEKEGTSLDSQEQAATVLCRELGYEPVIIRETYSGLTMDRPQLSTLRQKIHNGEYRALVVYSPDRLSRVGEDILLLAREVKTNGCKLIFVKEQWDDTLNGKVVAFMWGWASELEASQMKERTMRGKKEYLKQGKIPQGTGLGLYGYRWDKTTKKRVPLEYEAKVVNDLFAMIAAGKSLWSVAQLLQDNRVPTKGGKNWHPLTIKRMVTNPAYTGATYFSGILLPDATPPIIPQELFDRAQAALKLPKSRPGKCLNTYLLKGHIFCGKCGKHMTGTCLSKRYLYYRCQNTYPDINRRVKCQAPYVKAAWIEAEIWDAIKKALAHPDKLLAEIHQNLSSEGDEVKVTADIKALEKKIKGYSAQHQRMLRLFRHKSIPENEILDEINQMNAEKVADEKSLKDLQAKLDTLHQLQSAEVQLSDLVSNFQENLANATIVDMPRFLDALGIKITATNISWHGQAVVPLSLRYHCTNMGMTDTPSLCLTVSL